MRFESVNLTDPLVCDILAAGWRGVQITVSFNGTYTGGTIAWSATAVGGTAENITSDGTTQITTTTTNKGVVTVLGCNLSSVTATPSGITGTATGYTVTIEEAKL